MAHAPQEIRTFFVTSVTNSRHAFFKNADAAELFIKTLYVYRAQGRFELHEFVVMPDHFHLIITPAEQIPLEKAVQYIKGGYSTTGRRELGLRGVWQPSRATIASAMQRIMKRIAIIFLITPFERGWRCIRRSTLSHPPGAVRILIRDHQR
jgi:REP element-mobilizing transposase RayT